MENKGEAQNKQEEKGSNVAPVITTTTGAVAGGVITSAPAITAGGTAGLAGYSIGLGGLISHVGCGSAAAISTLSVVAAGPVIGGLIGFSAYKAIKGFKEQYWNNNGNSKDK